MSILLGQGNGKFVTKASYASASIPWVATTGDFNSDGKLDLAITNVGNNFITILLGNGDGTFMRGAPISTGKTPTGIAAGDFNEDGALDLIVVNERAGPSPLCQETGTGHLSRRLTLNC